VFCGSRSGADPVYAQAAKRLGEAVARRGVRLVYGGAQVGLMGAVADAALAAGGEVVGVMPRDLFPKEVGHEGLTELRVVASMHERKALMAELADGFVALPGGFGTLEEFCEVLTWAQLGIHGKPCALMDVAGFFAPLLDFFDAGVAAGFVAPDHRALVLAGTDPDALLDRMAAWTPPPTPTWTTLDRT
jgi:hypothetical protein